MILVDSSVWIDHFRDHVTEKVRHLRLLDEEEILVGDLILLEILQGARDDIRASRLASQLAEFEIASLSSPQLAAKAARNFRHLRASGISVRRTVDLIIATFCIEHGYALLHQDRDFVPFERHFGLKVL
jgi:predicted nucleic acid-binding protein